MATGWDHFYAVIARIPRGRVTTYGTVAAVAGHPRSARHVGYALAALRGEEGPALPWHRVLGAAPRRQAVIALKDPTGAALQRLRLESEGVFLDGAGRVSLERFGWPREGELAAARRARRR